MKWIELSVTGPPETVEPLSQIFYRYGHGGVAIEQQGGFNPDEGESPPTPEVLTLKTYLPVNSTTVERRARIDLGVRLVSHVFDISPLQEKELDEEEWQNSWKQHFHVLHVGRGIVIRPTWRDYQPRPSEAVVTLDPGMAFGTGHHPTTRRCLEQIEELMKPGMDVLDVGCGSGILSIAAAKLGARSVFGLEIDSVAIGVAKQNIRENGVGQNVRVTQGSLPHPEVSGPGYDITVANISARVISEIAAELVRATRPPGTIIASGILLENKDGVVRQLESSGSRVGRHLLDGDWVTLVVSVP